MILGARVSQEKMLQFSYNPWHAHLKYGFSDY